MKRLHAISILIVLLSLGCASKAVEDLTVTTTSDAEQDNDSTSEEIIIDELTDVSTLQIDLENATECYLDLRAEIPKTILCSDESELVLNEYTSDESPSDEVSTWNGQLSRVSLPEGWKIIAKYETYNGTVKDTDREGFVLLEGGENYLNQSGITIHEDKNLTTIVRKSDFEEVHDKVQFMYIYPSADDKMILSHHTEYPFGDEVYIGYGLDKDSTELIPNYPETCYLDLRGETTSFTQKFPCDDGNEMIIEPENGGEEIGWNGQLTYLNVPDGWTVKVYYKTYLPPDHKKIDPELEGFVDMSTGSNDLTESGLEVYADFQSEHLKRVSGDSEVSYRVQKIFIQTYNDTPLMLATSESNSDTIERLYIYPNIKEQDDE